MLCTNSVKATRQKEGECPLGATGAQFGCGYALQVLRISQPEEISAEMAIHFSRTGKY
jgi:hypothetical protein